MTASGMLLVASGTQDVTIRCYCTNEFGIKFITIRWFYNKIKFSSCSKVSKGHPCVELRRTLARLVIPTFNDSFSGTYTCANAHDLTKATAIHTIKVAVPFGPGK